MDVIIMMFYCLLLSSVIIKGTFVMLHLCIWHRLVSRAVHIALKMYILSVHAFMSIEPLILMLQALFVLELRLVSVAWFLFSIMYLQDCNDTINYKGIARKTLN